MDDKMGESEIVGRGNITDNGLSSLEGQNELPLLETTADDARSLTAVEASHVYDVLPEDCIRLLRILPGEPSSEVCCEMRQYVLMEQTGYTALSYTWGSEPAHHTVTINGKQVYVRKNLSRFLRQARKLGGCLMTWQWIDALCIDQSNFKEREVQVRLMPRIYRNAGKVLVWLGSASHNSDSALRAIAMPPSHWLSSSRLLELWSKPPGAAISALCHRPYFTRLWIFQELSLARRVEFMCGNTILTLKVLHDFLCMVTDDVLLARFCERREYRSTINSPAISIINHVTQPPFRGTLWELLQATQHLRCSDSRDKVYALLGVAQAGTTGIAASYTVPVPVLMNKVLRNEYDIHPPLSIDEAASRCRDLTMFIGVEHRSIYECIGPYGCCPAPQESDLKLLDDGSWYYDCVEGLDHLWWASFYGHTHVQKLYRGIADSDKFDVLRAARIGASLTMKIMLANCQLNVNRCDAVGRTAMHEAAECGHATTVELLLSEYSALAAPREKSGWTPLDLSAQRGHEDVVKVFLTPRYLPRRHVESYLAQALFFAMMPAMNGNESVARLLVDSGLIGSRSAKPALKAAKRYKLKGLLQYLYAQMENHERSKAIR